MVAPCVKRNARCYVTHRSGSLLPTQEPEYKKRFNPEKISR